MPSRSKKKIGLDNFVLFLVLDWGGGGGKATVSTDIRPRGKTRIFDIAIKAFS